MLYAERHRPRGVGLAGAVHRTWAVAEKNDWQFSNPRIDTDSRCLNHSIQPFLSSIERKQFSLLFQFTSREVYTAYCAAFLTL